MRTPLSNPKGGTRARFASAVADRPRRWGNEVTHPDRMSEVGRGRAKHRLRSTRRPESQQRPTIDDVRSALEGGTGPACDRRTDAARGMPRAPQIDQ